MNRATFTVEHVFTCCDCHFNVHREPPVPEEEVPEAEGDAPGDEEANEEVAEEEPEAEAVNVEDEEPEMWEETFKTYPDSKPYGEQYLVLYIIVYPLYCYVMS